LHGKRIVEFVVGLDGTLVSGPTPLVEYNGSGFATAAGLAAGPDGLYFTDLYKDTEAANPTDRGANILRVRFVGTADFEADVTRGEYPRTVQFTDLSTVPNPTAWTWYFGDGGTSNLQNPQHEYQAYGYYDVRLEVTSPTGLVAEQKNAYIIAINETAVEENTTRPTPFALHHSAPNPFGSSTLIRYNLASATHVRLRVFDVSGRLVQVLVDANQQPGAHETSWAGRDRHGQRAAAGVYFFRLEAGGKSSSQRVVHTR
jgi:PKD repeat protein